MSIDHVGRREVVVAAGMVLVAAACTKQRGPSPGTTGGAAASATAAPPAPTTGSPAPAAPEPPAAEPGPAPLNGTVLAGTADVPVGGGVILGDTVVTQPNAGNYLAFSTVCPHLGCAVNSVSGGVINCPCHGSQFGLDGSLVRGPATRGLAQREVNVRDGQLIAGPAPAPPVAPAVEQEQPQTAEPAPVTVTEPGAPDNAIARTGDIPVGGGVIVGNTVVTQPSAGSFVGLSVICTHLGCAVNDISGGTINCPCHGSKFNLDGSVAAGPATRSLDGRQVSVQGDWVVSGAGDPNAPIPPPKPWWCEIVPPGCLGC
ncbi:ubiquinol-cytochrome c reductase iron-sulfur subunit [Nocardia sp. NPDC059764]|uniref:QcrA and Rieske domain-containing protein n=1 Tax=Nocardia sp. NPDC059764 TaxID=3346939 RepID=UPI00366A434D